MCQFFTSPKRVAGSLSLRADGRKTPVRAMAVFTLDALSMSGINTLPNIGPVLAGKLGAVGIRNRDQLEAIGSVEAFLKIKGDADDGCYSMLFALEGAIRGIRWHRIPKHERDDLRKALVSAQERLLDRPSAL